MGSHGRTGIARAVVGSTAEEVIRLSDVPVAVAHADDMLRAGPIAVAIGASDAADGAADYLDEISRPGQDVGCMCSLQWVTSLASVPAEMLTVKGQDGVKRR
jgi:hypothetical protein